MNLEEKFYGDDYKRIVDDTRMRIESLALIHETIYNETEMDVMNIKGFSNAFANHLKNISHHEIEFISDIDDINLPINLVNPLVLLTNELTTNSIKYDFTEDDEEKIIHKTIKKFTENGQDMIKYYYMNNGVGLPVGYDINTSRSLGWTIILSLSSQLDGEYELINEDGLGFNLEFPLI